MVWPAGEAAFVTGGASDIEAAYDAFDGRHGPDTTAQMLASGANPVSA